MRPTEDEMAIAQALAMFSLAAIGTEVDEKLDDKNPNSSYPIRKAVGNAYVEFVRAEAKRVADEIKDLGPEESGEIQRAATVQMMAATSLLCGAMINFITGGFVATKAERNHLLITVFKDIQARTNDAQESLDEVRALASTPRTTHAQ